jgi:hypothetical protein
MPFGLMRGGVTMGTKKFVHWLNVMFCHALVLSMAALPAHAQGANTRAGFHFGLQGIFSTPISNDKYLTANANGIGIYAEKIWKSNDAVRVRYAAVSSNIFTAKAYSYSGDEVLFRDKLSYNGGIIDYLRYFDNKFVPHVFIGTGIFRPTWMDGDRHSGGCAPSSAPPVSLGLYYGIGWDFVGSGGQRTAIEFNIRSGDDKEGSTFEASLCFSFKLK